MKIFKAIFFPSLHFIVNVVFIWKPAPTWIIKHLATNIFNLEIQILVSTYQNIKYMEKLTM